MFDPMLVDAEKCQFPNRRLGTSALYFVLNVLNCVATNDGISRLVNQA